MMLFLGRANDASPAHRRDNQRLRPPTQAARASLLRREHVLGAERTWHATMMKIGVAPPPAKPARA